MPNLSYEKQHGRDIGRIICGVDEAGRGPLAGPVMAAAVILPAKMPRAVTKEIRDSKKMTAQQREDVLEPLTQLCLYAVAEATVAEISQYNILWASMLAMKRAVEGLGNLLEARPVCPPPLAGGVRGGGVTLGVDFQNKNQTRGRLRAPPPSLPREGGGIIPSSPQNDFSKTKIDVALIDGNRCPELLCKAVAIIEGDDKSLSIAAASIIAKVTRDQLMRKLAEEHPGYGWERNVGYGTREHIAALRQLGATVWHRPSFAPVMQLEMELAAEIA